MYNLAVSHQSGRPDLNRGPHRPERCALPGCATPRRAGQYPTRRAGRYRRAGARRRLARSSPRSTGLLEPERFEDYCVNGLQVPGAGARSSTIATRRLGARRAVRAGRRASSARAADRPPRPLLGLRRGGDRRRAEAPPADPVRRGHRARRLPPAARRPPGARQQRAARPRARRRATLEPFALHRGQPIGFIATPARRGHRPRRSCSRAVQRAHRARAARVRRRARRGCSRLAIVSGAGADYIADAAAPARDALLTGEPAERSMAQARESRRAPDRRRPLRDRDVRRQAPRRAPRRALRAAPRLPRRAQPGLSRARHTRDAPRAAKRRSARSNIQAPGSSAVRLKRRRESRWRPRPPRRRPGRRRSPT